MLKVRIIVSDENKEYVTKLLLEHGIDAKQRAERKAPLLHSFRSLRKLVLYT